MSYETDPLSAEKALFNSQRDELAARYPGHYLLIKAEEVVGAYQTFDEAVDAGVEKFGAGPFLVQSADKPLDETPVIIPALAFGLINPVSA